MINFKKLIKFLFLTLLLSWILLLISSQFSRPIELSGYGDYRCTEVDGSCIFEAIGWPQRYSFDTLGHSPTNSASMLGALLGLDEFHKKPFMINWAFWSLISALLLTTLNAVRKAIKKSQYRTI